MIECRIRPASIADAIGIGKVQVIGWQTTYQNIIPESYLDKITAEGRAEMWVRSIESQDPQTHWLVAETSDGRIVGLIAGGRERGGASVYPGEFFAIYILPEFQGRGIGSALMRNSAGLMINKGLTGAIVWVLAENPFRRFYESLGGTPIGEKPISIGGADLVEVSYGWKNLESLFLTNQLSRVAPQPKEF